MSDSKKKALLNETTTKRFWKLAGLQPIHEKAYVFEEDTEEVNEEEELEEMRAAKEDEEGRKKKMEESEELEEVEDLEEADLEERGMPMAAEDEPEMDMDDAEGPEDGQDVEVDVPEGDVASLRTARDILDQILSAVEGADAGEEEEPAMDEPEDLEEVEELDEELNEVDQEELEEVAERIASRVAKRIAESLKRK